MDRFSKGEDTNLLFNYFEVLLIASAEFQSVRGASHQPVFTGSRLAISHTCLPCLPSGRISPTCVLPPLMIGLIHNGGSVDVLLWSV